MNSNLTFVDDKRVKNARLATEEIDPELLDHVIQQTENFIENLKLIGFVSEDQAIACMPDGRPVNIKDMKETFFKHAPDILIHLAYRVKYLQGNQKKVGE